MLSLWLVLSLSTIRFTDVAETAGLEFRHFSGSPEKKYLLEVDGGGIAWIDYDRDGWPDLYLVNGGRWEELLTGKRTVSNALFRNNGDGTFSDVTAQARVGGNHWGMGAAVADVDNDGWPDLYVCNFGPNALFRNNGDGTFTDIASRSGTDDPRWGSSAAFADYDGDGRLDMYLTNYVKFDHHRPPAPTCGYRGIQVACGPQGLTPDGDVLYRNNGDGTFTDVTSGAGMAVRPAFGLGALWFDSDNDGDLDLYVANDSMGNFLFLNNGDGSFREMGLLSSVAYDEDGKEQAGMGVATGDYDRDGHFDLYVTNFSDDYNTLYRNLGNGFFRDVTYAADLGTATWPFLAWGTGFADLDNDEWEDLFVSNGHIYPQIDRYETGSTYLERNQFFLNLGNGKFREVKGAIKGGGNRPRSSRGSAFADYDNDGDLDIGINNLDGPPSLLRNDGPQGARHWLILDLEGVRSNRSAIGTRVTLETETGRQMREVSGGSSYQASNDLRVHFGLAAAERARLLTVRWPSGEVQRFRDVGADRHYHLREGGRLQLSRAGQRD
ncbi:MAG: CRTAC1 family protein [Acidobacteriota bacterium]|nr:CRTAC1 family protein [Acidobacteriota bacterium]